MLVRRDHLLRKLSYRPSVLARIGHTLTYGSRQRLLAANFGAAADAVIPDIARQRDCEQPLAMEG
jgi:hypothetical protein